MTRNAIPDEMDEFNKVDAIDYDRFITALQDDNQDAICYECAGEYVILSFL